MAVLLIMILLGALGVLVAYVYINQQRTISQLKKENQGYKRKYGRVERLLIDIGNESEGLVDVAFARRAQDELAHLRDL